MRPANRIKCETTSTGQGDIVLGAAVAGFLAPSSIGLSNGEMQFWLIEEGDAWELGYYAYNTTGPGITRSNTGFLVQSSTGAKLNLGAGTKQVSIALYAQGAAAFTPRDGSNIGNPPRIAATTSLACPNSFVMGIDSVANHQNMTLVGASNTGNAPGGLGGGTALGFGNTVEDRAVAAGYGNTAKQYSYVGGVNNVGSQGGQILLGTGLESVWAGQFSRGSNNNGSPIAQEMDALLYLLTTGATATTLPNHYDGSSELTIAQNRSLGFSLMLQAVRVSDGAAWIRRFEGVISRLTGNVALQGTVLETAISATAGFAPSAALTANTTAQSLRVTVTGMAATNIRWFGRLTGQWLKLA